MHAALTSWGRFTSPDWNPEVAGVGLKFLQGAGIRGLGCVEFKRDARNGRLVLIECNHRLTAATELLRAAGADLALFSYNRLLGRPTPPMEPYRLGISFWVPGVDLRAMLAYRRAGELSARAWARSVIGRQRFPVASIDDARPLAGAIARRLRRAPTSIAKRRGAGRAKHRSDPSS